MDDLLAEEITNFVMRDLKSKNSHVNNSTTDGSAQDAVNNIKDLVRKARGKAPKQRYNEQEIKDLEAHVQNLQTDLDECRQKIIDDLHAKKTLEKERDELKDEVEIAYRDKKMFQNMYKTSRDRESEVESTISRKDKLVEKTVNKIIEDIANVDESLTSIDPADLEDHVLGNEPSSEESLDLVLANLDTWKQQLRHIITIINGKTVRSPPYADRWHMVVT